MIATMARELDEGLRARGYVAPLSYGPRRFDRGLPAATEIVVERDCERGDSVTSPTGAHKQPAKPAPVILRRNLGVKCTVYAQSTLPGAMRGDHEDLCEALVDAFLTEAVDWLSAAKAGDLQVTEARMLAAKDFPDGTAMFEQWPGVAYLVRFVVPRGVKVVDFAGSGAAIAEGAGVQNVTNARLNTGDTATGCDSIT